MTDRVHPAFLEEYGRWRRAQAVKYFAQKQEVTPSKFIEANRVLGPPSMSEGPFRWAETPYLREIFETFWSVGFREGAVAKASQIGYTDGVLMNIVAYAAIMRPDSIAMLLPSDLFAEDFSKDKVEPLLENTPIVGEVFTTLGGRDRDATLLNKKMRSGHRLRLFGANSIARLKSFGSAIRLLDEIDEFENDHKQGDPEALLDRAALRAKRGRSRKLKGGTATMAPSRIWRAFEAGDQRRWTLTCPTCQVRFYVRWQADRVASVPRWGHVTWERTTQHHPASAHFVCPHGHDIPQSLHRALVQAGSYQRQNPAASLPSWHIPGMISLSDSMSLGYIAERFLDAGKDPSKLKPVVNTLFGEPFEDLRERIEVSTLRDRRELYEAEVPRGVGLLTCAVDVQRGEANSRLEVMITGWGIGQESWRIHHFRLAGNVKKLRSVLGEEQTPWERLDGLLRRWYTHAAGMGLRISSTAIDSADGEMTDLVYQFVKPRQEMGVFALRGEQYFRGVTRRSRMAEMVKVGKAKDTTVRLVLANTYALKDRLFGRLKLGGKGPGVMHWPLLPDDSTQFPSDYFDQFGNESRQDVPLNKHSSETESVYVQRGPNEAIDLEMQSLAALYVLGDDIVNALPQRVAEVQARGLVAQQNAGTLTDQVPATRTLSPGRARPRT